MLASKRRNGPDADRTARRPVIRPDTPLSSIILPADGGIMRYRRLAVLLAILLLAPVAFASTARGLSTQRRATSPSEVETVNGL